MKHITLPLAALCFAAAPLRAQADPPTPAAAVEAAFAAKSERDWPRFLSLVHPGAIDAFKQTHSRMRGLLPDVLKSVFQVESWEEYERTPADVLLTRWLESGYPLHPQSGSEGTRRIVGTVQRSDSVAYVVFEVHYPPPRMRSRWPPRELVRVITARLTPAGWRVMLNGGLVFDESGGIGFGGPNE